MLDEICGEIRNYFIGPGDIYNKKFTISGGNIEPLDFLVPGQYFRIVGSVLNDGVYRYPASDLVDEVFDGAVWAMSVPPAVLKLAGEIEEWCSSEAAKPSAYQSESFGGYTYERATDENGAALTWQSVFAARLNRWRKVRAI